jgi:hypothetical protein
MGICAAVEAQQCSDEHRVGTVPWHVSRGKGREQDGAPLY